MKFKDLTYKIFGKWFVICPSENTGGRWYWWCHCECGEFASVRGADLTNGSSASCGCDNYLKFHEATRKHGDRGNKNSPYEAWAGMKQRCSNPKHSSYATYGGRGIQVCEEWLEYSNFRIWAILHGWHKGLSIDRIDNSKGYSPENCQWITLSENISKRFRTSDTVTSIQEAL